MSSSLSHLLWLHGSVFIHVASDMSTTASVALGTERIDDNGTRIDWPNTDPYTGEPPRDVIEAARNANSWIGETITTLCAFNVPRCFLLRERICADGERVKLDEALFTQGLDTWRTVLTGVNVPFVLRYWSYPLQHNIRLS